MCLLGLVAYKAKAQQTLTATTPMRSPMASVSQTVGITKIEAVYSRPSVRGRKIWGGLVPYLPSGTDGITSGKRPWRAGANENTTISFNTAVTIQGMHIDAGTYGLHLFVYDDEKVDVMFSSNYESWGSFYFNPDEVLATVSTKMVDHDFEEYLKFDFAELTSNGVVLSLNWEQRSIPITIDVDVKGTTLSHLRNEMQSRHMINVSGPLEAATWCLHNDTNLQQALQWANYSISFNKMFANQKVKAELQRKLGQDEEANKTLQEALPVASVYELNRYGSQLLAEKETDRAFSVFEYSAKRYPDMWIAQYGLAKAYASQGNFKKAISYIKKAQKTCSDSSCAKFLKDKISKLESKESIS